MIELDLLGGRKSDKDTGSCIKAFSPRLIPSCCSVGIANSKIYIDYSLYNRLQTNIFPLPKGGPEEASRALCRRLKYHSAEGADLLGGCPGQRSGAHKGRLLWQDSCLRGELLVSGRRGARVMCPDSIDGQTLSALSFCRH